MDTGVVLPRNLRRNALHSNIHFNVRRSICRPLLSVGQLTHLEQLRYCLNDNLRGADAKWMTFITAVRSYRYGIMVQPYPPSQMGALEDNGINALSILASSMPGLKTMQYALDANELQFHLQSWQHIALLHWLLIDSGVPDFWYLQLERDVDWFWQQIGQSPDRPMYVFCGGLANPPLDGNSCCFYNGQIDQLYSMISGQAQMESYQLLSDLDLACKTAELCPGWGLSLCGSLLRCVAICERRKEVLKTRYLLIYGQRLINNDKWQKEEEELRQQENLILEQMLDFDSLMFNNSYALM